MNAFVCVCVCWSVCVLFHVSVCVCVHACVWEVDVVGTTSLQGQLAWGCLYSNGSHSTQTGPERNTFQLKRFMTHTFTALSCSDWTGRIISDISVRHLTWGLFGTNRVNSQTPGWMSNDQSSPDGKRFSAAPPCGGSGEGQARTRRSEWAGVGFVSHWDGLRILVMRLLEWSSKPDGWRADTDGLSSHM